MGIFDFFNIWILDIFLSISSAYLFEKSIWVTSEFLFLYRIPFWRWISQAYKANRHVCLQRCRWRLSWISPWTCEESSQFEEEWGRRWEVFKFTYKVGVSQLWFKTVRGFLSLPIVKVGGQEFQYGELLLCYVIVGSVFVLYFLFPGINWSPLLNLATGFQIFDLFGYRQLSTPLLSTYISSCRLAWSNSLLSKWGE